MRLTIGNVLWRDCIEKLDANWDAKIGEITKEFPSSTEAFVDLERTVDIWIIDESFPSDSGPRFLKVSLGHKHIEAE